MPLIQIFIADNRRVHIQSFFKLLGVPADRVLTLEGFRSWKPEYLATFRSLGYVPDAVVYGMTTRSS